jgi:hypothetical protein
MKVETRGSIIEMDLLKRTDLLEIDKKITRLSRTKDDA